MKTLLELYQEHVNPPPAPVKPKPPSYRHWLTPGEYRATVIAVTKLRKGDVVSLHVSPTQPDLPICVPHEDVRFSPSTRVLPYAFAMHDAEAGSHVIVSLPTNFQHFVPSWVTVIQR